MKQKSFQISLLSLLIVFFSTNVAFAASINCKDSFGPRFLCDYYASVTDTFSFNSIIQILLDGLIAGLILFILFQIVKAVFNWLNKSNDDKARGAAIKSISNAVVGIIVVIVLLGAVFVTSNLLNNGEVPNPLYACYDNVFFANTAKTDLDPNTGALNLSDKPELSGTIVMEKKGNLSATDPDTGANPDSYPVSGLVSSPVNQTRRIFEITYGVGNFNQTAIDFAQIRLYCQDRNTGKEHPNGYVILKRVGVNK